MSIRVVDLFSGAGGMSAGFHAASPAFATIQAVEMDVSAAASFEATFGAGIVHNDSIQNWLKSGNLPSGVDVVIGGPPCQGFSTLGKQDKDDERNQLWRRYVDTLSLLKPKYFVMENVPAFLKFPEFEELLAETKPGHALEQYTIQYAVLNAADYGAPQARKRAVVMGHRDDMLRPVFPKPTHSPHGRLLGTQPYVTVREALGSIPAPATPPETGSARRYSFGQRALVGAFAPYEMHWSRNYTDLSLDRFASIPEGGNRFDLPESLQAPCWRKHKSGSGDVMGRLHWDKPSVTIRTEFFKPEKGRYLHPLEDRAITHYEAALLQGFTEAHRFVGSKTAIAKQIGNAVPLQLGRALGQAVENAMNL